MIKIIDAATGMATSAPNTPRSAPPARAATTITALGTDTAFDMILGEMR